MGKVDDQRAMREARYAANNPGTTARRPAGTPSATAAPARRSAAKPATTSAASTAARSPVTSGATSPTPDAPAANPASGEICDHRNMGGKSCTRERGHEAGGTKNHRYS